MCLVQSVDEGLEPHEVANHLEDPQNPHDPQQPDDLPRLPDDVQVFKPGQEDGEEVGNQGDQVHLEYQWTIHLYDMNRSADFTRFIPSLTNFFLFGEIKSLATYSTKKKLTATVSNAYKLTRQ